MAVRGRPSKYTPKIATDICRRLARGESLRSICRSMPEYPEEATVREWVMDDRNGFSAQYRLARDLGLEAMADELLEISDDGQNDWMDLHGKNETIRVLDHEHVKRSMLRVNTRQWLLSKIAPKRYGDKQTVEHQGENGGPLQFVLYGAPEAKDSDEWTGQFSKPKPTLTIKDE